MAVELGKLCRRLPVCHQATNYSVHEMGYGPRDGTPQNAVQHCLWNALMTKWFGATQAKGFADRHEAGLTGPDTRMDLWNNAVGRSIGSRLGWFEGIPTAFHRCQRALSTQLYWIRN